MQSSCLLYSHRRSDNHTSDKVTSKLLFSDKNTIHMRRQQINKRKRINRSLWLNIKCRRNRAVAVMLTRRRPYRRVWSVKSRDTNIERAFFTVFCVFFKVECMFHLSRGKKERVIKLMIPCRISHATDLYYLNISDCVKFDQIPNFGRIARTKREYKKWAVKYQFNYRKKRVKRLPLKLDFQLHK